MEDILASIRRILSDDEAEQPAAVSAPAAVAPLPPAPPAIAMTAIEPKPPASRRDAALDVLALDAGMIIDEPPPRPMLPAPEPAPAVPPVAAVQSLLPPPAIAPPEPPRPPEAKANPPVMESSMEPSMDHAPEPASVPPIRTELVAPEAAAAAASSVGTLLRTLIAGREQVAVHRGGPTIEDLVREEIRPLLKQWLDEQLPGMVERLVRAEIERVVGRAG